MTPLLGDPNNITIVNPNALLEVKTDSNSINGFYYVSGIGGKFSIVGESSLVETPSMSNKILYDITLATHSTISNNTTYIRPLRKPSFT